MMAITWEGWGTPKNLKEWYSVYFSITHCLPPDLQSSKLRNKKTGFRLSSSLPVVCIVSQVILWTVHREVLFLGNSAAAEDDVHDSPHRDVSLQVSTYTNLLQHSYAVIDNNDISTHHPSTKSPLFWTCPFKEHVHKRGVWCTTCYFMYNKFSGKKITPWWNNFIQVVTLILK